MTRPLSLRERAGVRVSSHRQQPPHARRHPPREGSGEGVFSPPAPPPRPPTPPPYPSSHIKLAPPPNPLRSTRQTITPTPTPNHPPLPLMPRRSAGSRSPAAPRLRASS